MPQNEEQRRRRKAERARRYRAAHGEQIAEKARRWRAEHVEERAAYRRKWRDEHLDRFRELNRNYMRRKAAEERQGEERRSRKAAWARERYHSDVEASRAKARDSRARRRAADPEGYRAAKKLRDENWRRKHRDEINQRLREKNQADPGPKAQRAQRYYAAHADERRQYSRQYHEQHREEDRERSRQWRIREKRRREAGLPVKRLHRADAAERAANADAAAKFFDQPVAPERRQRLEAELRTPPELIAAWERDCERTRAQQYALLHPDIRPSVVTRRQAEEARMDAIARGINDRLRATTRASALSPRADAYEPVLPISTGGIGL